MKCIFCDEYRNDANQSSFSNIDLDYEDPVSGNIYHSMNFLFNGRVSSCRQLLLIFICTYTFFYSLWRSLKFQGSYRSEITGAPHSAR